MKRDFAIVKIGRSQEIVGKGEEISVNKLKGEPKEKIEFDQVLLRSIGGKIEIGAPLVKDSKVKAEIVEHGKAQKVKKETYKAKTRTRRRVGHRQPTTKIKILSI